MLSFTPFYTANLCCFCVGIGAIVCGGEKCRAVHGWTLTLQLMWWGIELEYQRSAS